MANSRVSIIFIGITCMLMSLLCTNVSIAGPIKLAYSIFLPSTHPQTQIAMQWAKEIESRTSGKVEISFFPGGTLTKGPQCYDGVVKSLSDIGFAVFAYTRGRFPVMGTTDNALGYPSGLCATRVINKFYRKIRPSELENVHVLYLHAHPPTWMHTKRPARTLEDLKGMKIRSTGLNAPLVKAFGAVPVAMSQNEVYDALKKGIVDGSITPLEVMKNFKQGEVTKYHIDLSPVGYTTTFSIVMNLKKWNSLPKDIQRVMSEVSEEWIDKTGRRWDEIDIEARKYVLSLGNEIIVPTEEQAERWRKVARPLWDQYAEVLEKKGLPGKKYLGEVLRLIAECSE